MYFSKSHPLFFGLATFICFNLPGNNLFASTTVTSSAGDTSPGTLSAAIININTDSSTTPILIENATPTLTSSPFSTITSNFTIESSSSGISRTIDGNNVTAGINITSGANTTFSSDIILTDVNMALTGSASKVIF
ncbi:MAG: hypothetical protein JSS09_02670, partial [Verrucomicrobia bacterium]|nr:hypothetical protein [Verrucomicrobiota bacterium]